MTLYFTGFCYLFSKKIIYANGQFSPKSQKELPLSHCDRENSFYNFVLYVKSFNNVSTRFR